MFDSRVANREYYKSPACSFRQARMDEDELTYVHMHNVRESIRLHLPPFPDQDMDAVDTYRKDLDYTPFSASCTRKRIWLNSWKLQRRDSALQFPQTEQPP